MNNPCVVSQNRCSFSSNAVYEGYIVKITRLQVITLVKEDCSLHFIELVNEQFVREV